MTEMAYDDRLVTVGIEVDGATKTYDQRFYIFAAGVKYASPNLGECELRIDNIDKQTRNYLLTQTSPFLIPRSPKKMTLDVGRASYGTFRLFEGNVLASCPTQPPDISLSLKSLTLSFMLGNVTALTQPANAYLSVIARQVATNLGVELEFKATDKQINNYSFSGASLKQVQKLEEAGNVSAFIDNNTLVVMDRGAARNSDVILVNKKTGMVGVPEVTEVGVRVRMLINSQMRAGDKIKIESDINPAATGTYTIFRLLFEIASRDVPFYWIIEARKFAIGVT